MKLSNASVEIPCVGSQNPGDCGGIKTACYPRDFKLACQGFSAVQNAAAEEMGFGPLLKIGCLSLNRELCEMVVDNLHVEGGMFRISMNETYVHVTADDFGRVMGLKNCGSSVAGDCPDFVDDPYLEGLKKCEDSGNTVGERLRNALCRNKEADDSFRKYFVMYALFVLLCPSRPDIVDKKIAAAVYDIRNLRGSNWAAFCFEHLSQGVAEYKERRFGYMSGCMVFLQLFIFELIYDRSILEIDKSIHPVVAWTNENCKKIMKWIHMEGGLHNKLIDVFVTGSLKISSYNSDESGSPSETGNAIAELEIIENEVMKIESVLDNTESQIQEVRNCVKEVEYIASIMTEARVRSVIVEAAKFKFGKSGKGIFSAVDSDLGENDDALIDMGMEYEPLSRGQLSPITEEEMYNNPDDPITEETKFDEVDNIIGVDTQCDDFGSWNEQCEVTNDNLVFPYVGEMCPTSLELMRFIFTQPEQQGDIRRDAIARHGEIVMKKEEFDCLRPGNPITRKVINLCAAYLCDPDSTSWFFPADFSEQSLRSPTDLGGHSSLGSIIRLCSLQRFNRRLKRCSKIFIPVEDGVLQQWWLVVIKLEDKVVEIWDSCSDTAPLTRRLEEATHVVDLVQTVFASDMKKPGDIYYNLGVFEKIVAPHTHVVSDKDDTGVSVIRNMQCYGEPWFEQFQSIKERSEIAVGILKNQKNEELKSVAAAIGLSVKDLMREEVHTVEGKNQNNCNEGGENVIPSTEARPGKKPIPTGWKLRSHRKRKDRI